MPIVYRESDAYRVSDLIISFSGLVSDSVGYTNDKTDDLLRLILGDPLPIIKRELEKRVVKIARKGVLYND